MNRKLIPAAAVATCAAAVLALFTGPVNADDTPGPVTSAPPTRAPSASPTARPSAMPSQSPAPGTPAPGIPTPGPTRGPGTGTGGGGSDATPTPRPSGGGPTHAPGCARPVPQLPTPESVPGHGTVSLTLCATDQRTARGKLVFDAGYDTGGPTTYRVSLRWTYEGKPEAGCEWCWSSARYEFTEDVYVNDAVRAEPLTVPFVLRHRGELIGEQRPGTGVTVIDIQPLEPDRQDNPVFVAPVPGATPPPGSP